MVCALPVFIAVILFRTACALHADDKLGIIGGYNVTIQDIPYIVSLHEITNVSSTVLDKTVCSGSIIHERFILTSASCIWTNVTRKIRAASDHWRDGGSLIEVEHVICHEDYDRVNKTDDICLLKLKNPIVFDWLTLPKLPEAGFKLKEGSLVNVTGWGAIQNANIYSMKRSDNLRQVKIPILYKRECSGIYGDKQLKNSQICAGAKDHDICFGDSGNPLTYKGMLIGIVSYGAANARCGDKPSVYTRVASYVDWIEVTIQDNP